LAPSALLEVIVCSVDDAIAAERGGAGRLEIIHDYEAGGLTPSVDVVRKIAAAVNVPLRVMLRETEPFVVRDEREKERLCQAARVFADLGVECVVLGFLQDGPFGKVIDHDLLDRVLASAPKVKATFHRAFKELANPLRAIVELKRHPQIDRILTSVGADRGVEQLSRLTDLRHMAQPEIELVIGGGTDAEVIEWVKPTGIREFHVGRAVRAERNIDGAILVERVAALVDLVRHAQ